MRKPALLLCLAAIAALAALAVAPVAQAQYPLMTGLGGPADFGVNNLPGNDDGSSPVIDLSPAFPGGLRFFGGPYTTGYVNNNGNITFAGEEYEYTPTPFPVAMRPMIAPYWGDVDTRGPGHTPPSENGVYWDLRPGQMVVTWHNVGYYYEHDDRKMDFQLIIRNALDCSSGDFDVEFRYNRCEWTTGDASGGSGGLGGTPAQAGFDAGNGVDFVEIPGSRTAAILDLCTTSNVGTPGLWQFSVRGGGVVCPGTGDPCPIPGALGACALGITQCVGRTTECMAVGTATPERCDGIDNDCEGTVDNDAPCPPGNICAEGSCVPPCFEHSCADGYTCNASGRCVETSCIDVMCPTGQRCLHGSCVDACGGVVCPHGQECVAGRCEDLCSVLSCGMDQVCQDGMCIPTCPCHACAADESCGSDGRCTPFGCDIVVCDPGMYCDSGLCIDACAGALCPDGQHCEVGSCVDNPPPSPDAGVPTEDMGTPGVDMGGGDTDAGTGGDGSAMNGDAGPRPHRAGGGCCHVGGTDSPASGGVLTLLVLGIVSVMRRRSRR